MLVIWKALSLQQGKKMILKSIPDKCPEKSMHMAALWVSHIKRALKTQHLINEFTTQTGLILIYKRGAFDDYIFEEASLRKETSLSKFIDWYNKNYWNICQGSEVLCTD
jgi:hypothetical protein